jgi:hypothetical protein
MKKVFFILLLPFSIHAETWQIQKGSGTYEVKHLIKKVSSESKEIKGKMECSEKECEFLIAAPVKSFVSSDSNRDSNMQEAIQASKFPVTSARGKFPKDDLTKTGTWDLPVDIDFHGVKQKYTAKVHRVKDQEFNASFTLKLDQHKIDRPSLFGVKIEDDVPMTFDLTWFKGT